MDILLRGKDPTEHLLCSMYRSVKMGSENIVSLLPKVEDKFLKSEMTSGLNGYMDFSKSIENMMHERGVEPSEPSALSKIGARAGAFINTVMNSSTSRVAKVCALEMRSSADRLESTCNEVSQSCDAHVVSICRKIIEKERQNSEKMEAFL
ncbi:MAG: hypothetical protein E7647_03055 [Ruminococcaceae bacterium]|nr:hypothetical protein [Oscillospiraceae bacterium]